MCGGSILNEDSVLSAGHCVYANSTDLFRIAVGAHSVTDNTRLMGVRSITRHPHYGVRDLDNDVSVFKLREPLKWSNQVGTCVDVVLLTT